VKNPYTHTDIDGLAFSHASNDLVKTESDSQSDNSQAFRVALLTVNLARRLGIKSSSANHHDGLNRSEKHDNLVFSAPLLSGMVGQDLKFLRGWKQYDSCVKGFNSLGLLAEHALKAEKKISKYSADELKNLRLEYLRTRLLSPKNGEPLKPVFSETEIRDFSSRDLEAISLFDLALWDAFAKRPIVCSTSSNMGISLHQAIRGFQNVKLNLKGRDITLLNFNEGWLIIWCPDERADFMNSEKTETLRRIESEQPPLTALHTYINRRQRDPGALRDALVDGGYFFPTNPQSKEEMQNLLFVALTDIAKERGKSFKEILSDEKILQALKGLDCQVGSDFVTVTAGVEGGLYGLMVPYLILLEETCQTGNPQGISTWNQASIGAALAAAVLADLVIRDYSNLPADLKAEAAELFPALGRFLQKNNLGIDLQTTVHGVFDIANLQSLAQLLGVVVEKHVSGRGTALVGLGSSSYANGNRCYDVLRESMTNNGPFLGKSTFHPMTHTLIPISQALIYAEDFIRVVTSREYLALENTDKIDFIKKHVSKPEPAGAASLAGYLLARLDSKTLSLVEIAYSLKICGFNTQRLLKFMGMGLPGANQFIQECYEEGHYMGQLAQAFLSTMDWDLKKLKEVSFSERKLSRQNFKTKPLDRGWFENNSYVVHLYLTGDNTRQPSRSFIEELLSGCNDHIAEIRRIATEPLSELGLNGPISVD